MQTLDDYLNSIRLDQMLGTGSFDQTQAAPQTYPGVDMSDYNPQPTVQPFSPAHQASDYLNSMMTNMPVKRDPTMLAKIFAGIAGLGGPQMAPTQEDILTGGYRGDMQDWLQRFNAANTAANMERQTNIAGENSVNQQRQRDIQQQRANEYGRRTTIAANKQESDAAAKNAATLLAQRKQALAEFNAKNPNYIYKPRQDGVLFAFNPKEPTKAPINTGVNIGDLGDMEKHNYRIGEIEAQGAQARETKETAPGINDKGDETTTTTKETTNPEGEKTTSNTTVKKVTKPTTPAKVKMVGPNGEGPFYVAPDKVAEAKKPPYNMKEAK